ncbi:mannose-6-phosphate isomerase, class I [Erwinia sorbitola]|uniref:mannose-6-phosphate isomerase n=1 Tax=Erwinia sorbitola TaxID=2681984 RepID=A0ABW9RAE5_9GAMM|nr:mannose-6-phosphate isomerase, class I [Erwinia sorbitola]MTD27009.1 mannose-6-phosphate isomerase, class I [Erwinia sorbitola]
MSQCYFYPLTNVVKNYPWGSHSALNQRFHVSNPDDQPQAELWMGVHPAGISRVTLENGLLSLSDLITADKVAMLGAAAAKRFGDLPYLLKILAADSALSIQVHPQKEQAELGYAAQGDILSGTPDYNDANHKPELVYAITPFMAMNGFREPHEIIGHFKRLDIGGLRGAIKALEQHPDAEGLKAFFIEIMQLPDYVKKEALQRLADSAQKLYGDDLARFIQKLYQHYPNDTGVLAPLFLNCVTLQPGEAMFLHPGTLHAYVQGTAIEVMASSDNVLRAGLTGKKINLTELVTCTSFVPTLQQSLLMAPVLANGQSSYPIPVDDFRFSVIKDAGNLLMHTQSAEILLVINGRASLQHPSGETLTLITGQSVFIPASACDWALTVTGSLCRVYC